MSSCWIVHSTNAFKVNCIDQGYSIILKKGSSYKCQNFSRSGHSHKVMKMYHVLDFSNKKA